MIVFSKVQSDFLATAQNVSATNLSAVRPNGTRASLLRQPLATTYSAGRCSRKALIPAGRLPGETGCSAA